MSDEAVEKKLKQQANSVEENIPDVLKFPNSNGRFNSNQFSSGQERLDTF